MTYSLIIVHEDGAVINVENLSEIAARWRFESAACTLSVVYAHYSNDNYDRVNHYVRENV